jgi:putative ABC transport system permease protein
MILLRLISWPYARKHLLRCLLTTAGIVLGVGVFVGMRTANKSVLAAFNQTIDRIAGAAQLQVTAGDAGFDEEVLDKIRELPEVQAAAPVIEATVATDKSNLLILGVDMLGDRSIRNYDLESSDAAGIGIDDPLIFLAQPDSLMITKKFADERGLAVNSRLPMRTMQGDQVFTVRGIMKPGGLANAFGGDLAIMDIYAAQKMFGRGRKFDRIDIALQEGTSLDGATAKLQALLGSGFQIEPPSSRGQQFESTSRMYALASNITSVFALFIGMFIIYNTFAIAVTERRAEIGILRALGATRGQIRTLFLTESAMAGLAGTCVGVLFGIAMARAMSGYIGGMLTEIYGVAQSPGDLTLDPWLIGTAVAMGLVTSLVAAVIPARSACGSGEGIAEGRISVAGRRRESRAAPLGGGVRRGFDSSVRIQSFLDHDLRRLRAGDSRGGAALARAVFLVIAGPAPVAGGIAAGGRCAGGGQLDSSATADIGHNCSADAVARVGDFAGRTCPVKL